MSTSNHETKTAFWAMVSRDLLVQWRDHNEFIFRVAMLPLILIVVYGFMLPTVGLLPAEFPTHMFCGMIGMEHAHYGYSRNGCTDFHGFP